MSERYNGWKNYQTWNVALWIGNDEGLYLMAKGYPNYSDFADGLREMGGVISIQTPDGVAWNDSGLDDDALDEMIAEL